MLEYAVDRKRCNGCGLCVADCPARIIALEGGLAAIAAEKQEQCLECQHCLAVCPTGAFSMVGKNPDDSRSLATWKFPTADEMETLIKGRRSTRFFEDADLPPETIQRLLEVSWHAPTGGNRQEVLLTVIENRAVMKKFTREVMDALLAQFKAGRFPPELEYFGHVVSLWEKGFDVIFRGAPHLVIASMPKSGLCPEDSLIALSTLDLFAQTLGVGTLWCGFAQIAFLRFLPEFIGRLGIPADHKLGYVVLFGKPAVRYARTVQRTPAKINRVTVC